MGFKGLVFLLELMPLFKVSTFAYLIYYLAGITKLLTFVFAPGISAVDNE